MFHLNIGGRKTDPLAQTIAMLHASADAVGAAEVGLCQFYPAFSQCRAHCRTGNAHVIMQHTVHRLYLKTMLRTDLRHQFKITAAPAAEAKIIAYQHKFRTRFSMQRISKFSRVHLRKTFVKTAYMHTIHTE